MVFVGAAVDWDTCCWFVKPCRFCITGGPPPAWKCHVAAFVTPLWLWCSEVLFVVRLSDVLIMMAKGASSSMKQSMTTKSTVSTDVSWSPLQVSKPAGCICVD